MPSPPINLVTKPSGDADAMSTTDSVGLDLKDERNSMVSSVVWDHDDAKAQIAVESRKETSTKENTSSISAKRKNSKSFFFRYSGIGQLSAMVGTLSEEVHTTNKQNRFIVIPILLGILVALVAIIAANVVGNELTKEVHVESNTLVGSNQRPVETKSADIAVTADGTIVGHGNDKPGADKEGQLLTESSPPPALATRRASLVKAPLFSYMIDDNFQSLEHITLELFNEAGNLVQQNVPVRTFARRYVPAAKCGSFVDIFTDWGRLFLDDTELHASKELEQALKDNGFYLSKTRAPANSRRLNTAAEVVGMFNFVKDSTWKCESVAKPLEGLEAPLAYHSRTFRPCDSSECYSNVLTQDGKPMLKPGVRQIPHEIDEYAIFEDEALFLNGHDAITVRKKPGFPGMLLVGYSDALSGTKTLKQVLNFAFDFHRMSLEQLPKILLGSSIPLDWDQTKELYNTTLMRDPESFFIAVSGLRSYAEDSKLYQTYSIANKTSGAQILEYWEDENKMPHKMVAPLTNRITYFEDVLPQGLDAEEWNSLKDFVLKKEGNGTYAQDEVSISFTTQSDDSWVQKMQMGVYSFQSPSMSEMLVTQDTQAIVLFYSLLSVLMHIVPHEFQTDPYWIQVRSQAFQLVANESMSIMDKSNGADQIVVFDDDGELSEAKLWAIQDENGEDHSLGQDSGRRLLREKWAARRLALSRDMSNQTKNRRQLSKTDCADLAAAIDDAQALQAKVQGYTKGVLYRHCQQYPFGGEDSTCDIGYTSGKAGSWKKAKSFSLGFEMCKGLEYDGQSLKRCTKKIPSNCYRRGKISDCHALCNSAVVVDLIRARHSIVCNGGRCSCQELSNNIDRTVIPIADYHKVSPESMYADPSYLLWYLEHLVTWGVGLRGAWDLPLPGDCVEWEGKGTKRMVLNYFTSLSGEGSAEANWGPFYLGTKFYGDVEIDNGGLREANAGAEFYGGINFVIFSIEAYFGIEFKAKKAKRDRKALDLTVSAYGGARGEFLFGLASADARVTATGYITSYGGSTRRDDMISIKLGFSGCIGVLWWDECFNEELTVLDPARLFPNARRLLVTSDKSPGESCKHVDKHMSSICPTGFAIIWNAKNVAWTENGTLQSYKSRGYQGLSLLNHAAIAFNSAWAPQESFDFSRQWRHIMLDDKKTKNMRISWSCCTYPKPMWNWADPSNKYDCTDSSIELAPADVLALRYRGNEIQWQSMRCESNEFRKLESNGIWIGNGTDHTAVGDDATAIDKYFYYL